MGIPNLKDLADPRGPVLQAINKLAAAMLYLAESNKELADAYRAGAKK